VLNLVMTHSPRLAAMANNKRWGEDAATNPAIRHRLAWLHWSRAAETNESAPATERALRERTA